MEEPLTHENDLEVGSIRIGVHLSAENGQYMTTFDLEGIDRSAALGHLQVVADRLRELAKYEWTTCPGCGEPWEDHMEDEDD